MKIIVDSKKTMRILENERGIFRGEVGADKLELYLQGRLTNEYPTITALLSNGRRLGAFTTDGEYEIVEIDGAEYTKADFTLSKENGFTLSEGKLQITIWMNTISGKREALGNVVVNVINTTAFDDGDIIISGDDVAGTVINFKVELENLQNQINATNLNITNLQAFKDLGIIDTLDGLNSYTSNGLYTFKKDDIQHLMLVSDLGGGSYYVKQLIIHSTPPSNLGLIVRTKNNNTWVSYEDFFAIQSEVDAIYDRTLELEENKASIEYVNEKFNQLFGEGQVSKTLDTIAEISRALEENVDVVEKLDESITNKADKKEVNAVKDLLSELNIYDYVVSNNPEVKDDTLYLENGYVRDGTLYLKNAKVENGVLYIDYIE